MEYLISINNQQSGPYSIGQLQSMIQNGQITLDYFVLKEGYNDWVKIDQLSEFRDFFNGQSRPNAAGIAEPHGNRRLRHGFTSFVLWLSIISLSICTIIFIIAYFIAKELIFDALPELYGDQFIGGEFGIWILIGYLALNIFGLYQILQWKKSGFNLLIIVNAASSFMNMLNTGVIPSLIASAVGMLILFGVLHIHNSYNAKTTWEQME